MKICMITFEFPPICAGIGYYVYNLSKNLINNGHEITVLTRGDCIKECQSSNLDGISVHRIRYLPIHPISIQVHGLFLNNILKSFSNYFDIIHIHNPAVPIIYTKCPIILTQHGTMGGDIENTRITDIRSIYNKIFKNFYKSIEINVIKRANLITAVSASCARDLRDNYKIHDEIIISKNGVDTNFFVPGNTSERKDYVLYTGRLHSRKGLFDLIECAKYVVEKRPHTQFILTGKGPLKGKILHMIRKLDLEKNVHLVGFVDKEELLRYYQSSSIYLLPSYYEGLPTSLLEAMSCGLASIATNVPGSSELIIDGKNGILVPPKEPKILAKCILRLFDDKDLLKSLGINARDFVSQTYDWRSIALEYEKLYIYLNNNRNF